MARKPRPTDDELTALSFEDFVVWFMDYNKAVIDRYVARRMIPNRYESSDIKSYMVERMLDILNKRKAKGRPIKNPRIYFGKLIDYWCVEFQRMNGYIYCMPKRPRCPDAEKEIGKHGFVYFSSKNEDSEPSMNQSLDDNRQLGYLEASTNPNSDLSSLGYNVKGEDPGYDSDPWKNLMKMALPEDSAVLECLFKMNMSIPEVSKHLNIAISTAYTRRDRGFLAISGSLASLVDLDDESWKVLNQVGLMDKDKVDIKKFYSNLD